jgi:tetratricopeptide (TPR) repeat protein
LYNVVLLPTKAYEFAKEALSIHKETYWKFQVAKCRLKLGKINEALDEFKAIQKENGSIKTNLWISKALFELEEYQTALSGLLVDKSESKAINVAIARIYEHINDHENASIYWQKVQVTFKSNLDYSS